MTGPAFFSRGELTQPVHLKLWHRIVAAASRLAGVFTYLFLLLLAGAAFAIVVIAILSGIALVGAAWLIVTGAEALIKTLKQWMANP